MKISLLTFQIRYLRIYRNKANKELVEKILADDSVWGNKPTATNAINIAVTKAEEKKAKRYLRFVICRVMLATAKIVSTGKKNIIGTSLNLSTMCGKYNSV
jgi:hypothetical protein